MASDATQTTTSAGTTDAISHGPLANPRRTRR
jgi:hypothetical protein